MKEKSFYILNFFWKFSHNLWHLEPKTVFYVHNLKPVVRSFSPEYLSFVHTQATRIDPFFFYHFVTGYLALPPKRIPSRIPFQAQWNKCLHVLPRFWILSRCGWEKLNPIRESILTKTHFNWCVNPWCFLNPIKLKCDLLINGNIMSCRVICFK